MVTDIRACFWSLVSNPVDLSFYTYGCHTVLAVIKKKSISIRKNKCPTVVLFQDYFGLIEVSWVAIETIDQLVTFCQRSLAFCLECGEVSGVLASQELLPPSTINFIILSCGRQEPWVAVSTGLGFPKATLSSSSGDLLAVLEVLIRASSLISAFFTESSSYRAACL